MARPRPLLLLPLTLLALTVGPGRPVAQEPRQIRVEVRFQQASQPEREAGVATERRVQRSSGLFTIVQDGGESVLTVATQVPVQQLAFYRDHATKAGHVASGVTFRDVGTTLRVQTAILPGDRIRVRVTPRISYLAAEGTGAVEFARGGRGPGRAERPAGGPRGRDHRDARRPAPDPGARHRYARGHRDHGPAHRERAVARAAASSAMPTAAMTTVMAPGRTPAWRAESRPATNGPANMPPSTATR